MKTDETYKRTGDEIKRPSNTGLDIYKHLTASAESFSNISDLEELAALSRWVVKCEHKARAHLKKANFFKRANQILSFLAAITSGIAGIGSVAQETDIISDPYTLFIPIFSFFAAILISTNNSILDCPGKYKEHMIAEAGYAHAASTIAVTLATYDTQTGISDFKSTSAAVRSMHLMISHLDDTTPEA